LRADHRADVYAVGIILYEMFTNAVPFTGETFLGVLNRHQHDPVPPMASLNPAVAISAEFQGVILHALQKRPDDRFQSMSELATAIAGTPEGDSVRARSKLASTSDLIRDMRSLLPPVPNYSQTPQPSALPAVVPSLPGEPARAQTQLGGTTAPRGESKARWGLLGALAVAATATGVGVVVFYEGRSGGVTSAPPPSALVEAPPPPPRAPEPGPSVTPAKPNPEVAPATVAPVTRIRLTVETAPPGALVKKGNFQVCDATPCEVLADPQESVELVAIKGNRSGRVQVLAQRDQRVNIPLVAPAAPSRPKEQLCEVEAGGIKILRPCK
jgi:serine/threonine-protein kinase